MRKFVFLAAGLLLACAGAAYAHHSFAAEFDSNAPVRVKGEVTRIEWANPHTWIYMNVKDKNGSAQKWAFEVASTNVLVERGWRKDDLKIGDEVTIDGFEAKELIQNRTYTGNARAVTFSNGLRVLSGSPGDGGPQPRTSS